MGTVIPNGYWARPSASGCDQVTLLSKVFSNHLAYDQVIAACNRSLKNLGTDYLDLYQIHWPPGSFGAKPVPMQGDDESLNGS